MSFPMWKAMVGLLVTIPDSEFHGGELHPAVAAQAGMLAAVIARYPGLRVEIEGMTDSAATTPISSARAEAVKRAMLEQGLPASRVSARGLGDARPLVSNSTASGREQNRRVEIIVSGEPIGTVPTWDRTYSLAPGPRGNR